MRLIPALFTFCLLSASAAGAVDIAALGKPLDNDLTPMRDRYVYFNQEANSRTVPIDRALLSGTEVEEWLRQCITDALSLTGDQYEQKTVLNQRYFTPTGYDYYISSLKEASLPVLLKEKGYSLSAVVVEKPDIFGQGLRDITPENSANGPKQLQYVWLAKVPAMLTYTNNVENISYRAVLEIELVRIPLREDGAKVGINSWRFGETKPIVIPENTLTAPPVEDTAISSGSRFAF